jgi:anti-sigma factor RsiW
VIGRRRHLGRRAAALVDGELEHDARDRALAHLANCDRCRSEVAEQRRLKARLRGLGDVTPQPALLAALDVVGRQRRHLSRRLRPRHPVRVAVVGCGAVVAGTLGTALAVGGSPERPGPAVTPPVDSFVLEHVATSDQLPLTDPDLGAAAVSVADTAGP